MSYVTLDVRCQNHIATVVLNRADKANAMNLDMWRELGECFRSLDADPAVRVVVLKALGKHFCSGMDLSVFAGLVKPDMEPSRRSEQLRQLILQLQSDLTAIERCRKPVLAAIHSACIGGGVDMICCADMRYATREAYFSIKEIDIGMTADVGTLQRLPKLIGDGQVRELTYTGRNFDAQEACRLGFVNRVFDTAEEMEAAVMALAATIASKSPLAIRGCKEMIVYSRDHSVGDALNYMATWNAGMLSTQDVMTAVEAQMKGHAPEFKD